MEYLAVVVIGFAILVVSPILASVDRAQLRCMIRRSLRLWFAYWRMKLTRYAHANNCPGHHGVEISCSEVLRTHGTM